MEGEKEGEKKMEGLKAKQRRTEMEYEEDTEGGDEKYLPERRRKSVGKGQIGREEQREMSLPCSVLESRVIITALLLPLYVLESQIQPQPISIHLY